MSCSHESRCVAIKAQLDHIYNNVDHYRLLAIVVVDTPDNTPIFHAPRDQVNNGAILLNLSMAAAKNIQILDESISFEGRFNGKPMEIEFPMGCIVQIYCTDSDGNPVYVTDIYETYVHGVWAEQFVKENLDETDKEPKPETSAKPRPQLSIVK